MLTATLDDDRRHDAPVERNVDLRQPNGVRIQISGATSTNTIVSRQLHRHERRRNRGALANNGPERANHRRRHRLDTIGGTAASGAGNVISGNTQAGVRIDSAGTSNNIVGGNLIGVNLTGTGAVANGSDGVQICRRRDEQHGRWRGRGRRQRGLRQQRPRRQSHRRWHVRQRGSWQLDRHQCRRHRCAAGTAPTASSSTARRPRTWSAARQRPSATSSRGTASAAWRSPGAARRATSCRATTSAPMPPAPRRSAMRDLACSSSRRRPRTPSAGRLRAPAT